MATISRPSPGVMVVAVAMTLGASAILGGRAHAEPPPPATAAPVAPPATVAAAPVQPSAPSPVLAPPAPPAAAVPPARDGAWYDSAFWGGPPIGTRIYGLTVAELGLTTSFASVGGGHGAVGIHYAERGGYMAELLGMLLVFAGAQVEADRRHEKVVVGLGNGTEPLASGFALAMDGYSRSLGGSADGFNARVVWGFPLGRRLPWMLDVGVASCVLSYHPASATVDADGMPMTVNSEVTKGGVVGFTVGLMVPLGPWAQIDSKVSYYLGGDRLAEATLVGNLTNRFYGGAGGAYWFGTFGTQLVGGLRL